MQELQPFSWPMDGNNTQGGESFFCLDERDLDNLIKTTPLDTTIFFTSSPLSSPISSPSYHSQDSFQNSPQSDFQPLESSSSDEEQSEVFSFFNEQLTENLGEFGVVLDNFSCSPLELGVGFGTFTEAAGSSFGLSCLPPLPIADQLALASDMATDDSQKPSKKRSRTDASTKKEKFTALSPDDLLKLDSREIEDYIKTLGSKRSLAPSEEKELKRVRRLIKNREYAQSSRNKKKQYTEEMEKKLSDMAQGSAALEKRVKELEIENRTLKIQLSKIGTAMKRDPSLLEKLRQATVPATAVPKMKAGAVLFVILFSFGLFFSPPAQDPSHSPIMKSSYSTARQLLSQPFGAASLFNSYARYAPDFVLDFAARYFWTEPDCQEPDDCDVCSSLLPQQSSPLQNEEIKEEIKEENVLSFKRSLGGDSSKSFVHTTPSLES